jgi:hypothetical protein
MDFTRFTDRQLACIKGRFEAQAQDELVRRELDRPASCDWLVQVPTASLYPPDADWYPDFPSDVYTEVECGAPVTFGEGGSFTCLNGHTFAGLEAELGPYGLEWQREQEEAAQ